MVLFISFCFGYLYVIVISNRTKPRLVIFKPIEKLREFPLPLNVYGTRKSDDVHQSGASKHPNVLQ